MSFRRLHIFCLASGIIVPAACAAEIYPGYRAAGWFADLCVKTAPTFEDASVRFQSADGDTNRIVGGGSRKPKFESADGRCTCSLAYGVQGQPAKDAANDVYVILEAGFPDEFLSGSQDPIQMDFEFDGVPLVVSVLTGETESGSQVLIPQISREGSCPV